MKISKRAIFEIILIIIIAVQGVAIYYFYEIFTNETLPDMKKMMTDIACMETLQPLFEYEQNGDDESVVTLAEYLLKNGYEGDTFVYQSLSRAYYSQGKIEKSIAMMEEAIRGGYLCEFVRPAEKGQVLDKAIAHMQLSKMYKEYGDNVRSDTEKEIAIGLGKKAFGEKYKEEVLEKLACKGLVNKNKTKRNVK